MTTVHIGYLKDSTVGLLTVFEDEHDGYSEFMFGNVKVIYFTSSNYDGPRWAAYLGGMTLLRSYSFEHLACFVNSVVREEMGYVVLIDCWIENHQ